MENGLLYASLIHVGIAHFLLSILIKNLETFISISVQFLHSNTGQKNNIQKPIEIIISIECENKYRFKNHQCR